MANNRMFLRCKDCGEEFFIGKRYDSYYLTEFPQLYKDPFMTRLNNFYDAHYNCKLNGPDNFELVYEMEPEYSTEAEDGKT